MNAGLKRDKFEKGIGQLGHLADGLLVFPDDRQVAVEVELTMKGKLVNAQELAEPLKILLSKQKRVDYIPLASGVKIKKNANRNSTWKIIENIKIESDI